jgi:hypothetical protein
MSPGLVAAYGFEEGAGTTLFDLSGNSNTGTLSNGPVWVTTGKYGKALRFDGVNDLVNIPDTNSLDLTTGMTLEAWVNPTSTLTGWDTVLFKGYSTGLIYTLYANGDSNFPYTYITSNNAEHGMGGGARLQANTWAHLAATYDGSVIKLFVNGVQVNSLSYAGTILTSNQVLSIGGNTIWTDEGFSGIIDEVRVYNRALTTSEINADMQTPLVGNPPTPSPSPTQASTATTTPTRTATTIPTLTAGPSSTVSPTRTSTQTPSRTPTRTASPDPTASQTNTATQPPSITPTGIYNTTQYIYPLKPSGNGRYFVDQNNMPFFINGDSPWALIGQVSNEDAQIYLQDAASKGINSIIVTLTESHYADNAPANYYGDVPFTTPNSFITPNEAYFAHADWVIHKAAEYGIQVIIAPNYLGCCTDGWWDELMNNNSISDAAWYGNYIGNRYKNFPNIMYAWGNDTNPCGVNSTQTACSQRDKIRAMAQAAFAADPFHLHTYHASPEFSALDIFDPGSDPWLTANATYTYQPVQIKSLQDYNRTAGMPFFLFESHYEKDWANAQPIQVRRQAYVAILSGAAGQHVGNNPIWHMNGIPGDTTNTWKSHLNDEARTDLPFIRALFESRLWYTLIPDQTHSIVIAGYGSETGSDYVGAARTSDGSTFIAYIPSQKQITLDMTKVSGISAKAWWFNPRDGTSQLIGSFPTTGTMNFTPSTNEDWVLVLDDASLNLSAPGFSIAATPTPISTLIYTPTSTATTSLTVTLPPTDTPTSFFTPTFISTETETPAYTATLTPTKTQTPSYTPTNTLAPSRTPTQTLPTLTSTSTPLTSTGFFSPTTNTAVTSNAGDSNGYETSPANAYFNDTAFAQDLNSGSNTNISCTNRGKDKHLFYNYNFNIPATAAIKGIEVRLDARTDNTSGSPKICIEISWDGGSNWTTAKTTTTLNTTETTYVLGGPTDTWSRTWSYTNFSNANFRIRVSDVASNTSRDFYLDYIAVNVTYQP